VNKGTIRHNRAFFVAAVAMTALQLWVANVPAVGQMVGRSAHLHWAAHFGSYVALALAWACALPELPMTLVLVAVAAFAAGQEAIAVVGHGHGFERLDVLVDCAGAMTGAWLGRGFRLPLRRRARQ
jgi:VanZ family protein